MAGVEGESCKTLTDQAPSRQALEPPGCKKGRVQESDQESRSLWEDRRKKTKTKAKAGKGDRKPAKAKTRKKASARK
jgi:hypothetical protein